MSLRKIFTKVKENMLENLYTEEMKRKIGRAAVKVGNAFDTFHDEGHFAQFVWRTIFEPQTIAHDVVDKFIGADVTTNPFFCGGYVLDKVIAFFSRQQKISAVSRTGTDNHVRHIVA